MQTLAQTGLLGCEHMQMLATDEPNRSVKADLQNVPDQAKADC